MPKCSLSYPKIVQGERKKPNLFEIYAELPPILSKDSAFPPFLHQMPETMEKSEGE